MKKPSPRVQNEGASCRVMRINVERFLSETRHLDPAALGAYFNLLAWYCVGGPFPDADKQIATVAVGCDPEEWKRIRESVLAFFVKDSLGFWRHEEADKWRAQAARLKRRASNASRARWGKSAA